MEKLSNTNISINNSFNYSVEGSIMQGKIYCINYTTVTIGDPIERHTINIEDLIPILITDKYLEPIGDYVGDEDCGYNWIINNPDITLWDRYDFKTDTHFYEVSSFDRIKSIKIKYVHELQNIFKFFLE